MQNYNNFCNIKKKPYLCIGARYIFTCYPVAHHVKSLKQIRIVITVVMLAECLLWVISSGTFPHARIAFAIQIVPSLIGSTLAAGIFWILATLVLGRVFCSSCCPIGTIQDFVIRLRTLPRRLRKLPPKPFRYKPARPLRYWVLGIYIVGIVAGIGCLPLLLEPWSFFVNITSTIVSGAQHPSLAYLLVGATLGFVCAAFSLLAVLLYSLLAGRDFCNELCPIGAALGFISAKSAIHIELIPDKCISCLKCEDVCKASCISIERRIVDNTRCVRCFNCTAVCPNDAIRFQIDRNGILSALMQRRPEASP